MTRAGLPPRRAALLAAALAAPLAGCGGDSEPEGIAGAWRNQSGSLTFADGALTRRAGRITQTGRYTLHDVTAAAGGSRGRIVVVMDGQKLDCRFAVKGRALTLAEPCATNFDGGAWTREG